MGEIENFREGPSTSKEINSGHKEITSPRDIVKDTYEKLKLEKEWKDQKERNENLVNHIGKGSWADSVNKLTAYTRAYHDVIKEHKIEKLNLSGEFNASTEHIEALKALNDKFENYLRSLEQHASTSGGQTGKERMKQRPAEISPKWPEIEGRDVNIPLTTKVLDYFRETKDHRPKRVKNAIKEFRSHIEDIKYEIQSYKSQYNYIPENLNDKVIKMIISVINDFNKSSAQAVHDHGNRRGREARNQGEESIKYLNEKVSDMNKNIKDDMNKWRQIRESHTKIKEALTSVPQEYQPLLHNLALRKLALARTAHGQILEGYQRGIDQSNARARFKNACRWFKEGPVHLEAISQKAPSLENILKIPGADDLIEEEFFSFLNKTNPDVNENRIKIFKSEKEKFFSFLLESKSDITKEDTNGFTHIKEEFENYLKQKSSLEQTGQHNDDTSGEILAASTLEEIIKKDKKRTNEDAYLVDKAHKFLAVFDGLGGHGGGDIASSIARDAIKQGLVNFSDDIPLEKAEKKIKELLEDAHKAIIKKREEDQKLSDMGTTASAVKIMKDGTAVIGHVGDSRVYLLRSGSKSVEQLTLDDNTILNKYYKLSIEEQHIVQREVANLETTENLPDGNTREFIENPFRQRIYQSLGTGDVDTGDIDIHIYTKKLKPGDIILVTSDGVHDNLTDGHIADCLLEYKNNMKEAINAIIQAARAMSGGRKLDDTTAVALRVDAVEGINGNETI